MQKLFLLFLLSGFTAFSFSQTSNKNDCDFDNIVTSDVVVSKYNRNPNKFKYVYTFNNSFNTNNNFRLNVDSYVCNYMSKNYKKIGFKKGEDYYKIKSFNVNDPNNTNDFYDCVELNDQTVFTNNLCIVEDLNQYANTTSLTTTSTTSTTFPTTTTLSEAVSNNTTTHETTTSDSNSVSTTDSTPTSNLNVNSEPPETSESKQEDTNKAMVGMAVGTALGVTLFIVLVIILVSHLKKRRYNVNNTNTNNLNTNNSNEDHKNNEYVEPTDSLYLEPISHNPEYKSTENGENEGVYYPNEPLSPVVEKNEIEHNYEYDYASPEHSPVYDNPTGNYSNVYESDE